MFQLWVKGRRLHFGVAGCVVAEEVVGEIIVWEGVTGGAEEILSTKLVERAATVEVDWELCGDENKDLSRDEDKGIFKDADNDFSREKERNVERRSTRENERLCRNSCGY